MSELQVKPSKKLFTAKIEVVAFLHIFAIANQSIKKLLKVINVCEYNYGNRLSSHFFKKFASISIAIVATLDLKTQNIFLQSFRNHHSTFRANFKLYNETKGLSKVFAFE